MRGSGTCALPRNGIRSCTIGLCKCIAIKHGIFIHISAGMHGLFPLHNRSLRPISCRPCLDSPFLYFPLTFAPPPSPYTTHRKKSMKSRCASPFKTEAQPHIVLPSFGRPSSFGLCFVVSFSLCTLWSPLSSFPSVGSFVFLWRPASTVFLSRLLRVASGVKCEAVA